MNPPNIYGFRTAWWCWLFGHRMTGGYDSSPWCRRCEGNYEDNRTLRQARRSRP